MLAKVGPSSCEKNVGRECSMFLLLFTLKG